jgi:hypothetical protein
MTFADPLYEDTRNVAGMQSCEGNLEEESVGEETGQGRCSWSKIIDITRAFSAFQHSERTLGQTCAGPFLFLRALLPQIYIKKEPGRDCTKTHASNSLNQEEKEHSPSLIDIAFQKVKLDMKVLSVGDDELLPRVQRLSFHLQHGQIAVCW